MKKPVFTVIDGGRKDADIKTPRPDFDVAAFMQSETINAADFPTVDPSLYGKTIDGITYPEPVDEMEIYLISQRMKDDPDFTP